MISVADSKIQQFLEDLGWKIAKAKLQYTSYAINSEVIVEHLDVGPSSARSSHKDLSMKISNSQQLWVDYGRTFSDLHGRDLR